MRRYILLSAALLTVGLATWAQSGTNSPYSQFGLGQLGDGTTGFNKGMGGVGTALSHPGYVNTLNPASYTTVDSLTFIFDIGISGQVTNLKEGQTRLNARNASVEYIAGSFRLAHNLGLGFGIMPYSNIGYSYSTTNTLQMGNTVSAITETYKGEGGLHRGFIGLGWQWTNIHVGSLNIGDLRLGATGAYIWGSYKRTVSSSSSTYINSIAKTYEGVVNSYGVDLGMQWRVPLSKNDAVTLGATMGLGHKLNTDPTCTITNTNSVTSEVTDSVYTANNALSTPMTYGVGLAYNHGNNWLAAADVELQQWGKIDFPQYDQAQGVYAVAPGLLSNSTRIRAGLEWTPNSMSRSYFERIHYRLGGSYATSYYKVRKQDGPREISLSFGLGLPIQNYWGGRSTVNVSAAWVNQQADNMIRENTFRINIGITFNERWFQKWKVQ